MGMKEQVGYNTRKDPPKGLMGLQLSPNAEVETATKGEREMRDVTGRPSHPLGDKKKKKSGGDKQPMDRRSISTCTKAPGR